MKVAFDENVPIALVRVFQTFANEKQLKKLSPGLTIESAKDYTPKPSDSDFDGNNDVPWIKRFAAAGGRVIISGNVEMQNVAHERLALVESGMIVFFFERKWSDWQFYRKCSLLLNWWPHIAEKAKRAKKGSFWCIPNNWAEDGTLRRLTNQDKKRLKIEKQISRKSIRKKPVQKAADRTKKDQATMAGDAQGKLPFLKD